MNVMKSRDILGRLLLGSLAALLVAGSPDVSLHKVKAAEALQKDYLEDDEVLVKGGSNSQYVLNKNYSVFNKDAFSEIVHNQVGEQVKIWDVENNLKNDLNIQRQQKVKHYEGYHLMTNEERDDMVEAAKQQNLTLKQYLINCGMNLSNTPKHMTTACGGPNRIWHYSDPFNMGSIRIKVTARHLYLEKFDISNNHRDNTMIGNIFCPTEDEDRFMIPENSSNRWKFLLIDHDHFKEFAGVDYLMLYVKN